MAWEEYSNQRAIRILSNTYDELFAKIVTFTNIFTSYAHTYVCVSGCKKCYYGLTIFAKNFIKDV